MSQSSSDTESADVKATSTATTATTAAASDVTEGNTPAAEAAADSATMTANNNQKKSKRLPSFAAIFKRMNERDSNKRKYYEEEKQVDVEPAVEGETATNEQDATAADGLNSANAPANTDGNDNQAKEDKQLVYAELVLKPAEQNNEPLPPSPPQSSTEYAEIVYVKKEDKK